MKRKLCVTGMVLAVLLLAVLTASKLFWQKPETSPEQTEQKKEKEILIKDFTCASLRKQLSQEADADENGVLSEKEVKGVTKLELEYADSESLDFQELDCFSNLKELTVSIDKRTGDIVLEKIPHVTKLNIGCYGKRKKGRSVVIRDIEKLENLDVELYSAPRIAIEKCDSLDDIYCVTNASVVRVSDLRRLERFMLSAKKLKSFQLDNISSLKELIVNYAHPIKKIDLSGLDKLERFDWEEGGLEKIIWGKKDDLWRVSICDNNFQGVLNLDKDIPKNVSTIDCRQNKITEIIGKKKKYIYSLDCQNNKLQKIDLPNTELLYLGCTGNKNVQVSLLQKAYTGVEYSFDKSAKVHYKRG